MLTKLLRLTMLNGDNHDLTHHGSVANMRRWAMSYLQDQDIVSVSLFYTDSAGLSVEEVYGG